MKRLLILSVVLIISLTSMSQYWAPPDSEWHYSEKFFGWSPISEDYIKLEYEKDTIVEGILCSKIIKRHQPVCWCRPYYELMYFENNKVFFWDVHLSKFQVLYNFGLEAEDSYIIEVKDDNDDIDTLIVIIDSTININVGDELKKKQFVTYNFIIEGMFPWTYDTIKYNSQIIETIGDIQYMFNYIPQSAMVCDGNFSEGLRCYYDDTLGLFETGIAPYCEHIEYVGIDNEEVCDQIRIVNPFVDKIDIDNSSGQELEYKIRDISAREISNGQIQGGNNSIQINGKGLHIIEIYSGDGALQMRRKVIGL